MASTQAVVGSTALVVRNVSVAPTPAGVLTVEAETPIQRYVRYVYGDLFGRAPDPGGLATWTAALAGGTPRVAVANAITASTEFRTGLIADSYAWYLEREPDAGGLRNWLGAMASGWTISQMESGFLASPEYYARAGSTDDGWVRDLYDDVLQREPAWSEVSGWTQGLRNGVRRDRVAMGFLLSTEHLSTVVDGYYQHLLGRSLDPSGQRTWVGILQSGGRDEAIIGGIIASEEYWGTANRPSLDHLVVTPQSATIKDGGSQTYTAEGFDALGRSLGDVTSSTTFSVDRTIACAGAVCAATAMGHHAVVGSSGAAYGSASLHVAAGSTYPHTTYAWGGNTYGELGDGTGIDRWSPVNVGGGSRWVSVSTSYAHTVAVDTDGTVWAWGYNGSGQLGDGTITGRPAPVRIGTDADWDVAVAGGGHTVALKTDGTLWAWGNNYLGALGDGTDIDRRAPVQIGSDNDWASIDAGGGHTMAIKADGTLWAWGNNSYGETGTGVFDRREPVQVGTERNWDSVACGAEHTVAVRRDGTLWAWGNNDHGQLGLVAGPWLTAPAQIGTDTNWRSASAGVSHTAAVRTDGTLWAWGWNQPGQLGDGTTSDRPAPVQVGSDSHWESVAAGNVHTAAVKTDGTLWTWGGNESGQLGDGTTISRTTPLQVGSAALWASVTVGSRSTVAVQ